MILAKGSNPEMNVSKGLNHSRVGETHQSKLVLCGEITLRHMEHMVVVEKNTWFQIPVPGFGAGKPPKSHGTNVMVKLLQDLWWLQ